jgi:hypothetical protein
MQGFHQGEVMQDNTQVIRNATGVSVIAAVVAMVVAL